ncbi:hypothetical protein PLICRDRAFT_178307 [Plicaturopsis crispa FD-325 SS-3]|nr:hypothetical protein PLICRDRAFT_178307 [Plicaturopsis crispa FD-325 SS-3]
MAPPTLKIASPSQSLPTCSPNLMPFHIAYSGVAPISTYLRAKPAPARQPGGPAPESAPEPTPATELATPSEDAGDSQATTVEMTASTSGSTVVASEGDVEMKTETERVISPGAPSITPSPDEILRSKGVDAKSSTTLVKRAAARFVAAFRGRTVHGVTVDLPEGYAGVVLRGDSDGMSGGSRNNSRLEKKPLEKPKSKRRTRTSTRAGGVDMDVDVAEEAENESADAQQDSGGPSRTLELAGTFSSFVLWHPDIPVDDGRDEYLRSLTEWTKLSAEVHRFED